MCGYIPGIVHAVSARLAAREVWVTLHNRKKYKATIVGTDRGIGLLAVAMGTITALDVVDIRFPTSRSLDGFQGACADNGARSRALSVITCRARRSSGS